MTSVGDCLMGGPGFFEPDGTMCGVAFAQAAQGLPLTLV